MKAMRLRVRQKEAGTLLVDFMSGRLGVSKKRSKAILDSRNVLVDDRRTWMARHVLHPGNVVDILPDAARRASPRRISIVFDDDAYLIVNKPAGMLSNGPDSVEAYLRSRPRSSAATVAHRLDRDTSGCLLAARGDLALKAILPLFRKHLVRKQYHALTLGRINPPRGTIRTDIDQRRAVTHFRTLDANRTAGHILVRTETGRTHQIRKHLASIRHPILGDRRYGLVVDARLRRLVPRRQMLHASLLEFTHPLTGKKVRARASLPKDFRACLKALGLS
jgi:23S rRNA pseudouridine1911/1915/1917 synthase